MSSHPDNYIEFNLPARKILRKMDMLGDQEGIYHRYRHEKTGWDLHCAKTKTFIEECFYPDTEKTIAVFGSGWMLDVPATFLLGHFNRVDFYDLHHPMQVREKYKQYPNARFIETDITGGLIQKVYSVCSHWKKPDFNELLAIAEQTIFSLYEEVDYRISVNLLNQLDILIIDYIKRYHRLPGTAEKAFREAIQRNHLKLLKKDYSCLITDYEEVHLANNGDVKEAFTLLHTRLPEGTKTEKWDWIFDTRKTYNPDYKTNLRVVAIKL